MGRLSVVSSHIRMETWIHIQVQMGNSVIPRLQLETEM